MMIGIKEASMPTHGLITELWFDDQALEAATFYTNLFPDSHLGAIHHYTTENPSGKPIGSDRKSVV